MTPALLKSLAVVIITMTRLSVLNFLALASEQLTLLVLFCAILTVCL